MFQPIPLPKIIADVGPGGPLVTSLGGINALRNAMYEADINKIKRQYAPLTTQAEAASKLAYANLINPQYIAKIMSNPRFMASLSEDQKNALKDYAFGAAAGTRGSNAFTNMPTVPEDNNPTDNSFGSHIKNAFLSILPGFGQKVQGSPNPMQYQNMPRPNRGQYTAPAEAASPPVESEASATSEAPLAQNNNTGEDNIDHAIDQEYIDYMNEHPDAPTPSQEYLERRVQAKIQGKNPNDIPVAFQNKNASSRPKTYAERAAEQEGIIKEGEKLGELRAKSKEELDNEYAQALQMKVPLDRLTKIVTNPKFQNLRNLPGFQRLQMNAKINIGTPEEKKLIGEFQAAAKQVVAATIKGFGGRILASEIPLSESMKLSDNDSIEAMLGKEPVIKAFNEMTLQRSRIASKLMKEYHLDKGDALERADKMVDGEAIRKKVEMELNPITEDDIDFTAKETGMTRQQVIDRLKAEGRYNG